MTTPEVTMIIPTRHRAALLEATLHSLLLARSEGQRTRACKVRLMVVDDASEDEQTLELVRALPSVDFLRVEEHDGRNDPGAAIAFGVAHVDTEYHALFGDDDIALPRHFVAAAPLMAAGNDVVSSSFHLVDQALRETSTVVLTPTGLADVLAGRTRLNDGSFVRHELVRDLDWDVSLEAHMLVPIWARLMADGATFARVGEPTWLYRRHDGNISLTARNPHDMSLRERAQGIVDAFVASRPDVMRSLYSIDPE